MKKIIKIILATMTVVTMCGCGSSSTAATETSEEVTKEPELKEIELNDDNWQDYFEVEHRLEKSYEEYDFYMSDVLYLSIKEEYKEKLTQDDPSVLTVSYEAPRTLYYATLNGDKLEIGEEIDVESIDISEYKGWDKDFLDMLVNMYTSDLKKDTITISNNEMTEGKRLLGCGFQRTYTDPYETGENSRKVDFDGADESVWGIVAPSELKFSGVSGKLYIYE